MNRLRLPALAAALLLATVGAGSAAAQGVTTGAVSGTVSDPTGQPVNGAQVQVRSASTGFSRGTTTNDAGRYTVLGLEPGAYDVTVRRIGFQPREFPGVVVTLSQTTPLDVQLSTQATQLSTVTVEATASGAVITPSRTGTATTITDSALSRLPTLNRNFTDFVRLTPQVSSSGPGLSGGGTNNRYNSIQIDGATESDIFGLGSTGQPGGQAGGKSISIESVKEYQVLLSPYDVRQGNFSGVLINAVTKSGTNDFFGSIYGYGRNDSFTRSQPYITEFEQAQYGFSLGGPIVKDRLLFFVNPEFQTRTSPAAGLYQGNPALNLSDADLNRFVQALESRGMTDLGSAGQVTNRNPLTNIFGRVDLNLGNTQVVLRHNYGQAEDDNFSRGSSGSQPSFPLTSNQYFFTSEKNATVGQVRTSFDNGAFNELIVGYTTIRDARLTPGAKRPQIDVYAPGALLLAGSERSSAANELDQDIIEFTNNFTMPMGNHRITIGTQNQLFKVRNLFGQQRYGRWIFGTLDSLEAGTPRSYTVGVPAEGDGAVRFTSVQYAGYLQDEWEASPNLRISLGVRVDVPTLSDKPPYNPDIEEEFGRNTSEVPTGNLQWSPRVGFNWDVTGDRRNQLRGGAGLFTGRPAFVWLSNAFQNSGLSGYRQLTCNGANAPDFTSANLANAPVACRNGTTARAGSEINLLDKDLKFPQNFRASLGYDRDLGNGLVATFEGLYTRGVNNLFYRNLAFVNASGAPDQGGIGVGEHGRVVFGERPNSPSVADPSRNRVLDVINHSKDYSYSLTAGLTRRFIDRWEGSLFYTYGRAFDVQSLTSSTASSQYNFGRVLSGAHDELNLTPSAFDQPHRWVATGTYSFPSRTDVSVIWVGESGSRYDYVTGFDMNGDGLVDNDPIYVPRNALDPSEILFASSNSAGGRTYTELEQRQEFESFIRNTPCLRENRGRILPRLECQQPFTNRVDVSIRQSLPTFSGQNLTLALDVINFGNLLFDHWGRVPTVGQFTQVRVLSGGIEAGKDLQEGARGVYRFAPQSRFNTERLSSNYQAQLSLRYSF